VKINVIFIYKPRVIELTLQLLLYLIDIRKIKKLYDIF